jgi:DNA-binding transcriptional MerR regulator
MKTEHYDIVPCRRESKQVTLQTLAMRAGVHPALVERFVEFGLIEPAQWDGSTCYFDVSAIPRLRMIGRLRGSLGINLAGIAVILDLLDRMGALQRENEMQRSRLG